MPRRTAGPQLHGRQRGVRGAGFPLATHGEDADAAFVTSRMLGTPLEQKGSAALLARAPSGPSATWTASPPMPA